VSVAAQAMFIARFSRMATRCRPGGFGRIQPRVQAQPCRRGDKEDAREKRTANERGRDDGNAPALQVEKHRVYLAPGHATTRVSALKSISAPYDQQCPPSPPLLQRAGQPLGLFARFPWPCPSRSRSPDLPALPQKQPRLPPPLTSKAHRGDFQVLTWSGWRHLDPRGDGVTATGPIDVITRMGRSSAQPLDLTHGRSFLPHSPHSSLRPLPLRYMHSGIRAGINPPRSAKTPGPPRVIFGVQGDAAPRRDRARIRSRCHLQRHHPTEGLPNTLNAPNAFAGGRQGTHPGKPVSSTVHRRVDDYHHPAAGPVPNFGPAIAELLQATSHRLRCDAMPSPVLKHACWRGCWEQAARHGA